MRALLAIWVTFVAVSCTAPGDPLLVSRDAGDAGVEGNVDWERDIWPIIEARACPTCHNPTEMTAGLDVTEVAGLLRGGYHGPAVVPCEPGSGTLLAKLSDEPPFGARMPYARDPLEDEESAFIAAWIARGATETPDPTACEGLGDHGPDADGLP